jgi:GNAT superfamily N-acetyltransferase
MKTTRPLKIKTDIEAISILDVYLNGKRDEKTVSTEYRKYKGKLFVAEDFEDQVIGFVSLSQPVAEDTYIIDHLAVLKSHRGLGIGSDLVRFIMDQAKGLGGCKVYVLLASWNESGHTFYRKLGFKPSAALPEYQNEKKNMIWFVLDIVTQQYESS